MSDEWKPTDETYSTAAPICPYCGHEHTHDGGFFYDEDLTQAECEACGKTFGLRVYTSTSWTASSIRSSS